MKSGLFPSKFCVQSLNMWFTKLHLAIEIMELNSLDCLFRNKPLFHPVIWILRFISATGIRSLLSSFTYSPPSPVSSQTATQTQPARMARAVSSLGSSRQVEQSDLFEIALYCRVFDMCIIGNWQHSIKMRFYSRDCCFCICSAGCVEQGSWSCSSSQLNIHSRKHCKGVFWR